MAKPTDNELRPYGYVRGKQKKWCATCGFECENLGEGAFKCRPCASKANHLVEREIRQNEGMDGVLTSEPNICF